jgi:hypothetical protein
VSGFIIIDAFLASTPARLHRVRQKIASTRHMPRSIALWRLACLFTVLLAGCGVAADTPSFRFFEINGTYGFRVEMRPSQTSEWGTVCSKDWSVRDAQVACRAATGNPFPVAAVLYLFTPVSSGTPIYRQSFMCRGNEANLTLCPLSFEPEPANCTHEDDLHVVCGCNDALSGCCGPQDCHEWALVERNLIPNCNVSSVFDAPDGLPLDHSECRRLAWPYNVANSKADNIPAYVVSHDSRRCTTFRCQRDGFIAMLPYGDSNAPTSLYAKIRSISASLGLCTRPLSCNGRGVAALETVLTYDATTTAVINAPHCACTCDEGYAGLDCGIRPSIRFMPDHVIVVYTTSHGEPLDSAAMLALADRLTAQFTGLGVVFTVAHGGNGTQGYRLVVRAISSPLRRDINQAGVARLLAEPALVLKRMNEVHPDVNLVEIGAAPTTGLQTLRQYTIPVSILNKGYSANTTYADSSAVRSVTTSEMLLAKHEEDDSVIEHTKNESVRSVRVFISNAFAISAVLGTSKSEISVTADSMTMACEPITVAPVAHPCDYRTYCDIATSMALSPSKNWTIRLQGVLQACDGVTPLTPQSLQFNVTPKILVTMTSSLDLRTAYDDQISSQAGEWDHRITPAGIWLLVIASVVGVICVGMLIALMSAVCDCCAARDIGSVRRLALVLIILGAFAGFAVFVMYGLQSFYAVGLQQVTDYVVFVDRYHSPLCSSSEVSYTPRSVSVVVADGNCQLGQTYGVIVRPLWIRAACNNGSVRVALGDSEQECAATNTMNEATGCLPTSTDLSEHAHVFCVPTAVAPQRLHVVEAALDPFPSPNAPVDRRLQPLGANAFRRDDDVHTYFNIGAWISRAHVFGFFGIRSGSSASLSTFSYADVVAGQAGTLLDVVTFDSRETPPLFETARVMTNDYGDRRAGTAVSESAASSPEHGMAIYGPLFNGFDSAYTSRSDRYGAGAMRLYGIAGSIFDLGSFDLEENGVTVTFWMRVSNTTRGYVFLATDAWTDDEGATPIADHLTAVLDTPGRTFFDRTWTAYSAIFADGTLRTLKFAYHRPLDLGGDGEVLVFDDPDVIGDLFDDAWHFVAFTIDLDRDRTKVQIFVDGRSSYLGNGYQRCMQEGQSFPAVRELPADVTVTNPYTETVRDGGVAYVGHLNGGVYAFTVHNGVLSHTAIVSQLGTPSMRAHASIDVTNSRLAGAGFIVAFFAGIVLSCAQIYLELRVEREKVSGSAIPIPRQADSAGSEAGSNSDSEVEEDTDEITASKLESTKASMSQRGLAQLAVVIPALMQVCQNMSLYFEGMEWPPEFQLTFEWIYFPFSVDIFWFLPGIPLWIAFGVQFSFAILAFSFLVKMRASDSAHFDHNVVQHCEENGLDIDRVKMQDGTVPNPSAEDAAAMLYFNISDQAESKPTSISVNTSSSEDDSRIVEALASEAMRRRARRQLLAGLPDPQLDMEASKQSVLEFKINGQKVAGLISRVAIQNSITTCLREPDRPAPTTVGVDNYLTVLLHPNNANFTLPGFNGLRQRAVNQLALLPMSLESKLELSGFVDISTVPTSSQPLLEIIRDCETLHTITPTESRSLTADQLTTVVRSVNLNYSLAAVLPSAAREVVDRCMEMRRTSLVDRLRGSTSADPDDNDKLHVLRQLAEMFPMITYYRMNDRLRRAADTIIAEGVTVRHVLDLVRRPADAFDVFYGLEQVATNAKDQPIMTLLSAARAAGAPIPNVVGARAAGATTEEWEHLETIRVLAGCFQAYDDETRALIVQLFFIMNPSIAEGDYKTKYTQQWHDLERIAARARRMFVGRLAEVQKHVDFNCRALQTTQIVTGFVQPAPTSSHDASPAFVFHSIDPTMANTHSKPTKLELEIQAELPRCPVHGLRLIAAVPEIHDVVRERLSTVSKNVYPCAHRNNLVFQLFCSEHKVNEAGAVVVEGCNTVDYKVCPDDSCNFSICDNCAHGTLGDRLAAFIARRQYLIRRYGLATTLGLLVVVAAQAMYQPTVKRAITAIFCHSTLLCDFPDCYNPAAPAFLSLAIGAAVVLLVFGLGLFWLFLSVVWDRKEAILRSSALRNHLMKHSVLPCFDPHRHESGQEPGLGDVFLVSADPVGYASLLRDDSSLFRGLYEQYEFRWMYIHPFTFVFKIAIVCVVLYSGEPNTLRVILLSGLVELVQLVFYIGTEPFTDPWLDILAKGGSLHQIVQLGLVCFYRADTFEDRHKRGVAYAMIFFATAYLLLFLVVLGIVVVIPAVRTFSATRRKQGEQGQQEGAQRDISSEVVQGELLALDYSRTKKLKSASESVLRQHFFTSDDFNFALAQQDSFVMPEKVARMFGDVGDARFNETSSDSGDNGRQTVQIASMCNYRRQVEKVTLVRPRAGALHATCSVPAALQPSDDRASPPSPLQHFSVPDPSHGTSLRVDDPGENGRADPELLSTTRDDSPVGNDDQPSPLFDHEAARDIVTYHVMAPTHGTDSPKSRHHFDSPPPIDTTAPCEGEIACSRDASPVCASGGLYDDGPVAAPLDRIHSPAPRVRSPCHPQRASSQRSSSASKSASEWSDKET